MKRLLLALAVLLVSTASAQLILVDGRPRTAAACSTTTPFTDDFSSDPFATGCWTADFGASWAWDGAHLTHSVVYNDAQIYRRSGTPATDDDPQWAKVTATSFAGISTSPSIYVGVILRGTSLSSGAKYSVAIRPNDGRGRVMYITGSTATQVAVGGCGTFASGAPLTTFTLGALVTGTGTGTVWSLWNAPSGNCADATCSNWGAATCTYTNDPATPVDTGNYVGVFIDDSGAANETVTVDDFAAGP